MPRRESLPGVQAPRPSTLRAISGKRENESPVRPALGSAHRDPHHRTGCGQGHGDDTLLFSRSAEVCAELSWY